MTNEELMNKALEKMLSTADSVQEFAVGQAPEVVQQLLTYQMITSLGWVALWLAVVFLSVYVFVKHYIIAGKEEAFWSLVPGILGSMGVWECSTTALKIWIAPKVYILEYVQGLVA